MALSPKEKAEIIAEAQTQYVDGDQILAGMLIYERIPLEDRSEWAGNILELLYPQIAPIPEIDAALNFVREPHLWPLWPLERQGKAHRVFDAIRSQRLTLGESPIDQLNDLIYGLAEDVVGVTYTTRQFSAPFDHHRGWRIVKLAKEITEFLKNAELATAVQNTIFDISYLQLTEAVSCNPGCPSCHPPRLIYHR